MDFRRSGRTPYLLHLNTRPFDFDHADEDRLAADDPAFLTSGAASPPDESLMVLSLITNDVEVARQAEQAGVERIMIDLERRGKAARQVGRSLFLSSHEMEDVCRVRSVLARSKLAVRIDPLHPGSRDQINRAVSHGADFIVLPFFERLRHAEKFVAMLDGRAAAILLVESASASAIVAELCQLPGVTEIHIGLNDLSISLGLHSWCELLTSSVLEELCAILRASRMPFGFGGIGSLSCLDLPITPELVLAQQVCQGATRGWLSRAFRDAALFHLASEVQKLREAIDFWGFADAETCAQMRMQLTQETAKYTSHRTPDITMNAGHPCS